MPSKLIPGEKKTPVYKKSSSFKMNGFSGFGNSPVKHTTNRVGHEKRYGKGHDNSAHPNYWKKTKTKHQKDNPEKYTKATTSEKEREIEKTKIIQSGGMPANLPYTATRGG